ncbi:STAS domain-containing protein [Streptomyces sp. NPDC048636]|uniref:STAS domain-containing protein n=1 Tax=Streptomyces sp. NPDC048636 TaxID=3155762 RepID=UPI0034355806
MTAAADRSPSPLTLLTSAPAPGTVRITVVGDLEYDTVEDLLLEVADCLARHPHLGHLRLDLAELAMCDSMGLSALLQIRRFTGGVGARLHLDHRPPALDRLLDLTGTLDHLLAPPSEADRPAPGRTGALDVPD